MPDEVYRSEPIECDTIATRQKRVVAGFGGSSKQEVAYGDEGGVA